MAVSLVALVAAYFGLLATLIGWTRGLGVPVRVGLIALFAVAIEWLRGDAWYLRFPWYTPPHALAVAPPCLAGAHWLGVYGLSFAIWLIAALGAYRSCAYAAFLLLPACWFLLPSEGTPNCRVLLLQTEQDGGVERLIPTIPAEKVDLAVLPELAYRLLSPEEALARRNGPAALAHKTSSPVVFGAVEGPYPTPPSNNVAAVIGSDGRLLGTFPKQHPVPLMADGLPGDRCPVFPMDEGVLGVAICYDFDAPAVTGTLVSSGATVLVAPTMDAMGWTRSQHEHHALLCRLRAVENHRWLLRASTSGRSEVISPHGVPSSEGIEVGAVGHIILPYAHRDSWALGGRLSWLGPLAAAGTVLFFVGRSLARRDAWRRKKVETRMSQAE
jgi:apolipoprotein N-acyltransferase